MLKPGVEAPKDAADYLYTRVHFDVTTGKVARSEELQVTDDMDFLGGIGRSFKIVADYDVVDPFASSSPLVINTGCLTGTAFMTGLRTYFTGYSPLKRTVKGMPMAAWSAMSGSFGRKLVSTGIGDLVLTGAADAPQMLVVKQTPEGPEISLTPAPSELVGTRMPDRFEYLNARFNDVSNRSFPAHFAAIGPAGENWETVWYASIAGSTQELVMTGEEKFRFAGRMGMGSVLGSKNVFAIVVTAEEDVSLEGDERLKAINLEIGRGEQSKGFRHPNNRDGLGGTGKNERLLDGFGVLPVDNFDPRGENLAVPVHLETVREAENYVVVDKGCFGCQIACHQDVYQAPEGGKDPDLRVARRNLGPYLGRYEYEAMELAGPNLGILDPDENLRLARLSDDLGFDAISINVVLSYLMDHNTRGGDPVAGGLAFGDAEGSARVMEEIASGEEKLFGKGVKATADAMGGAGYAMHSKGVEHSAYLGQTNPGYPFAVAGGHMSMRTFLLYVTDPECKPESADYWVEQITKVGWAAISKDLYGGCLFTLVPPPQIAEAISSVYGIPMTPERLLDATHRAHLLGFALEQKQGITPEEYSLPKEIFAGQRKGDLPGVHFLTEELFEEIRGRVLAQYGKDAEAFGYGKYLNG